MRRLLSDSGRGMDARAHKGSWTGCTVGDEDTFPGTFTDAPLYLGDQGPRGGPGATWEAPGGSLRVRRAISRGPSARTQLRTSPGR